MICITLCTCAIALLHKKWMCLGMQRNTHITGNNLYISDAQCVSTRFYFSVYATNRLVRLAVFVAVKFRAPCLLTPCTHLGPVNSDNTRSTTDHSLCLNGINSCCVSPPPTTTLCVFDGKPCLCNLVRCPSM